MSDVYENTALVLEKAAAYIDTLEGRVIELSSTDTHRKIAAEQREIDDLVSAISTISSSHSDDDLRNKLSSATDDVRGMIRDIVGQQVPTDLGELTEKISGRGFSYDEDPEAAFLSWLDT